MILENLLFDLLNSDVVRLVRDVQERVDCILGGHLVINCHRDHKRFFYELCPLVTLAGHVGDDDTRIALSPQGTRFDGRIIFSDGREQIVEMTAAIDGHNDALVRRICAEYHSAPLYQATDYLKDILDGRRPNEGAAICMDVRDEILLGFMKERLRDKKELAKSNQHYASAWLGIVFDEWPVGLDHERWDRLATELLSANDIHPFERAFCVGIHGSYIFDSAHMTSWRS